MMTEQPVVSLPEHADVAIIGGGMVGLSLALLLARSRPALDILVIEAFAVNVGAGGHLQPSFDARSTALSHGSREIFQQAGLWDALASRAATIATIHVSDRGNAGVARLAADQHGLPGLGYVLENRVLGGALIRAVAECANVRLVAPARVDRLIPEVGAMVIAAAGQRCRAGLAVVAEGVGSATLEQLGIHTRVVDYGQCALIANIALDRPHGGVAYERFTDQGPMALLPLPEVAGEHRAALVWTLPPDRAERLKAASEPVFLAALQERFGHRAGRFCRRGECATYPLRLAVAAEQVRRHLAVVGNAAHLLHPVAGQGFNLALRDVARLAEAVIAGRGQGRAAGDLDVLEAYVAAQQGDQQRTILFSDRVPRLFAARGAVPAALRNTGLIGLDLVPGLRAEFARFGAGLVNPAARLGLE